MEQKFYRNPIRPNALPDAVQAKWPSFLLTEGVVPLSKIILRKAHHFFKDDIRGLEKFTVLIAIVDYKRKYQTVPPSYEYLSFVSEMELEEFKEISKLLEADGLLKVKHKIEDRYEFNIDGFFAKIEEILQKEKVSKSEEENEIPI